MSKRKGFTLIELLVVISIIALLVSILMPALNRARQQATAAVCLGNQKALIASWLMYQPDNNDKLVGGMASGYNGQAPFNEDYRRPAGLSPWICAPTVEDTSGANKHFSLGDGAAQLSTLEAIEHRKFGIELGELWKYSKTHEIYHCPGDKNYKEDAPNNAFVSYAITGVMNGEDIQPGHNGVAAYTASGQIKQPAEKMVFVEESTVGQSFLLGSYQLTVGTDKYVDSCWWDFLAVWHNKRGTIAFADGHAEINQWEYKYTRMLADIRNRNNIAETFPNINEDPRTAGTVWNIIKTGPDAGKMQPDMLKLVRWYGGR